MNNQNNILCVMGSINLDISSKIDHFPIPGETITGSDPLFSPGGKGANQANAASLFGASTMLIGAIGHGEYATRAIQILKANNVDLSKLVTIKNTPTGLAMISLNKSGENSIIVCSGANKHITLPPHHDAVAQETGVFLFQGETPISPCLTMAKAVRKHGGTVIFNAAPVCQLEKQNISDINILLVNEIEMRQVAMLFDNCENMSAEALATRFSKTHEIEVLLTLGNIGSALFTPCGQQIRVPAYPVHAVDTTGAGDTYAGVFAACTLNSKDRKEAMEYASVAAALSCEKRGAQMAQPDAQTTISEIMKSGMTYV